MLCSGSRKREHGLAPLSPCGPSLTLGVELPLDAFFLSARDQRFESVSLQRRVRVSRDFALPRREDTTTYESDVFALPGSTQKICQLTGDLDRQFMRLTGNHTELRYNLRGTDLGVSFEGDPLTNVTYFLFGDSVPIPKDDDHLEVVGATSDEAPFLDAGTYRKEYGACVSPYLVRANPLQDIDAHAEV